MTNPSESENDPTIKLPQAETELEVGLETEPALETDPETAPESESEPESAPAAEPKPTTKPEPTSIRGVRVPFAGPPTKHHGGALALKIVLPIVAGVIIICVIIGAFFKAVLDIEAELMDELESVAVSFMDATSQEQWNTAYDYLCAEYKEEPVSAYTPDWENWDGTWEVAGFSESMTTIELEMVNENDETITLEMTTETNDDNEMVGAVCGWED